MKEINSVLIAGAGAIGSMVAAQIFQARPESLSILAGGERLARYRAKGFIINGSRLDFPLTDARERSAPDLIIIACKAHHLKEVIADLAGHVAEQTLILSLLNGISSEDILAEAFGRWRVPYAMILKTDAGHSGNRTDWTNTGTIFFGDTENPSANGRATDACSERVRLISDFFDSVAIRYQVPAAMLNRLWYKFMINVGLNQITAVLRLGYGALRGSMRGTEATNLMEEAMREVVTVAAAEGQTLTEADVLSIYPVLDDLSPDGKTSMLQDVEAGRKTEVELFSYTVISLAARHGIAVPVNAMLYRLLRAIEQSAG